ncbi:nickel ABC transporter substrate-binding protein [Cohnella sp. REN36]|uniref:nickel ABC transporter substrate-binding protein n=1 Tax=Cohnella sp. REN36 TaxID=2887347 RepID=UPI001D156884|nr:nickel ABC transporter substrate-binding protein [Cohnella sp. REN36]MCC3373711.1 nickel ABC transporter substrate-binding protein [Cohnella sp. REN36]
MKLKAKYAIAICLLLSLLAIIATGCKSGNPNATTASGEQNSTPAPVSEEGALQTLKISWNKDIGNLNPHMYVPNQFFAQAMVYEGLVNYGEGGKIEPSLAESWNISEDGKRITFHLRHGVTFSDGSPFTAANVKRNFDAVLMNKKEHGWLELINQIDGAEAKDDYTFVLRLKHPYYPALQELTIIRPLRFLGDAGFPQDNNTAKGILKPIGTGPWVLSAYTKDQQAVFTRNERYWGDKPKLQKVIVKIIPDSESRVLAFQKGDLDMIYGTGLISLDEFAGLKASGRYSTSVSKPTATRVLVINTAGPITKDLKVRQALEQALDKKAISEHVFGGVERPAESLISDNFPNSGSGLAPYAYNMSKSSEGLEQAGWMKKAGSDYRTKDGKELTLELKYISADSVQKSLAEVVQGEFKKAGVNIKLMGLEEQSFWDDAFAGKFDLVIDETWGAPYDPHSYVSAMRSADHSSSSYAAQQGLPMKQQLDQQIGQIMISTDEQQRAALYKNVFATLQEQAVYIPISYEANIAVLQNKVNGFAFPPTQYELPLAGLEVAR